MSHPLVEQLRFARSELRRALADARDADARKRLLPMNCISWNIIEGEAPYRPEHG